MKIIPRIPIFLGGNTIGYNVNDWTLYFNWYNELYKPEARILGNTPLQKRKDFWKPGGGYDTHHLRDNLESAAWSNYNYTLANNKNNVTKDILYYADNSGVKYIDGLDFVTKYNQNIDNIFNKLNLLYNYNMKDKSWTDFNRNYNLTYHSKGEGSGLSTILYDPTNEQYRGTSTHARRVDLYLKNFDDLSDDEKWDRIHKININGKYYYAAKEANGHLRLLPDVDDEGTLNGAPSDDKKEEEEVNKLRSQETGDPPEKESFLNKINQGFNKIAPDLLEGLRLAGSLYTNGRVFKESEKAIIPNLLLTYQTHRLIVGDEATKQAYYRRAVLGETKAAQPFTSDADRLMAYMMDAKRVGDELRAQGDLADNAEIRRTSDESNQHEWANTQRATEVANANITEMNKAEAAKHQLRALKYLADWTNIDLFLLGRLAKIDLKRNKDLAYLQLLLLLEDLHEIATDEKLLRLKTEASTAYDKYYEDTTNLANYNIYKAKLKAYLDYEYELKKRILSRRAAQSAKSGAKLEYKDKTAKFLYKTSKDIVEHFRRMSKMTDDSRVKTLPKPIKLSSHPKKKLLMGGVAPFYVYRPYMSGMELSVSSLVSSSGTSSSSSSKKDNEGKDKLDMIKELFKAIQGQGLPIDVSTIYKDISKVLNRAKAFGEDLSTDDIASMYLNSMLKINNLKYSKDVFDKAKAQATANDALNEYAVTVGGALVLLNREGEIKLGSYLDYVDSKGKWNPITNDQLLNLRAYSPNLALFKGDELMLIVNNGVGMSKIASLIKSLASTLGSSELKIEGISEVENKRVKAGLLILTGSAGTPDGFYKVTLDKKDSSANVRAALTYIYNMLPTNYKTVLKMHSGSEDNSKALIASMLASQVSSYYKEDIAPLTGKAATKDDKNPGDKVNATFNDLLLRGQVGVPREFSMITKDENTKLYSLDAKYISQLPKVNSDMSVDRMLAESEVGKILDSRLGITFGDQVVSPENLKDIMFSVGGGATVVTLPCKYENGHKVVNFAIKDEFDEAIKEASKSTPIDWTDDTFKLNLANILKEKGLDSLLTTGMLLDPNMLGQFLVVEGYSTDRVKFNKNSKYIEKVSDPTKELEERLSLALSTKGLDGKVLKYNVDINDWGLGFLFEGGWDDIYHASVFIPLNNDPISALIGSSSLDRSEAKQLASEYLNYLKLIRAKNTDSNLL